MERFYSLEYNKDGKPFAMHIYATPKEAEQHAKNLDASCEPIDFFVAPPDWMGETGLAN